MMDGVTKKPGITTEREFIEQLREKYSNDFGQKAQVYVKALEMMHRMVCSIYKIQQ